MSPLRIAVLDDHSLIRMALRVRLAREADFDVVGIYSSSRALLEAMPLVQPDLLLMDYVLGERELDGAHLLGVVRRRFPLLPILVASSAEKASVASLALSMGANGFFGKSEDVELLVSAIRRVASGETYVSPGLAYDVMRQRVAVPEPFAVGDERAELYGASLLSPREQEVLRCCLDGMSVTQISRKFLRSIKTISGQKRSAYRKLGIHNDSELFRLQSSLEAHTR